MTSSSRVPTQIRYSPAGQRPHDDRLQHAVPADAILMYRGLDAQVGFISKFATVEAYVQSQ